MAVTNNMGYDVVLECSGTAAGATAVLGIIARGGRIVYAAMYPNDFEMPVNLSKHFYHNEITMTGMLLSPYTFPRTNQLLTRLKLDDFTENYFYIDDVVEAFKTHLSHKYPKILILCNKDLENK
jgi:(R,R)-butanediol dehydrogenase/meso-butanediol dehydrogenase/diacetyl reductase/L-iditol 2-dehydrogenase